MQKQLTWKKYDGKIHRSCHQMISHNNYIYLFLGEKKEEHEFSASVVQYNMSNGVSISFSSPDSPIARRNHVVVKRDNHAYLFGGDYERYSDGNELYKFDLQQHKWKFVFYDKWLLDDEIPSPRKYHCGCLCYENIYIFGGEDSPTKQFNDLWCLNMKEKWTQVGIKSKQHPKGRRYASIVSHFENLYLFGGRDDKTRFNDLWRFNTLNSEWTIIEGHGDVPSPRASQTAVVCHNSMWIYGGNNGKITNELFEFNIMNSIWTRIEHDNVFPRYWHASTLTNDDEMVIHGGWNQNNLDDYMSVKLPVSKKSMKQILHESLCDQLGVDIVLVCVD